MKEGPVYTQVGEKSAEVEAGFYLRLPALFDAASGGGSSDSETDPGQANEETVAEPPLSESVAAVETDAELEDYEDSFEDFENARQDPDGDLILNFTGACPDEFGLLKYNGCPSAEAEATAEDALRGEYTNHCRTNAHSEPTYQHTDSSPNNSAASDRYQGCTH